MKKLVLLLCLFTLSGCSWMKFWEGDDEDELKPAELVKFDEEIKVRKLWSQGVGSGQDVLYATLKPALDNGVLYTADSEGRVYAVNGASGKVLWKEDLEKSLSGGVGAGHGLVLVGDLDGRIFVLDADSGQLRWRQRLGSEILSAPVTNGRVVIVQTQDAKLVAFDATSGEPVWQFSTDIPNLTLRGNSSPVITGNTVVSGFASGKIIALNTTNGSQLWENRIAVPQGRTELERMVDVEGNLLLVNDVVYATSYQGRVAALSRGTGRALWYQELSSYRGPGSGADQVFVSQDNDEIKALRGNSGQVLWTNDQLTYRQVTGPVFAGGYLAVGDAEGYLHVMSPVDGRFLGRVKVDGSGISVPMVSDGATLFVLDNDGDLTAYQFEVRQ